MDAGIFELSKYTLESLLDALDNTDFGIFVFAPDDITKIRGKEYSTARDNVVFELGMFIGRLGKERSFIIIPNGAEDFHLPTDLLGITPARYAPDRTDNNINAALGSACNKIKRAIEKSKPSINKSSMPGESAPQLNDTDYINIMISWMGTRPRSHNARVFVYADVDRELKLPLGTASRLLTRAAAHWEYQPRNIGAGTVLFEFLPTVG